MEANNNGTNPTLERTRKEFIEQRGVAVLGFCLVIATTVAASAALVSLATLFTPVV